MRFWVRFGVANQAYYLSSILPSNRPRKIVMVMSPDDDPSGDDDDLEGEVMI